MRTSSYTIYLHLPDAGEYYLVHGYSGAVDKVSAEVVKYLTDRSDINCGSHTKDQRLVEESLKGLELAEISSDSVELLVSRGYLTEMSFEQERAYVERLAGFLHKKSLESKRPAFMMVPSYECNLRCPYCFEADTRVQLGKLAVLKNVMLERQVDAAFDSMDIISEQYAPTCETPRGKQAPRAITLYGGEPLMKETLPIVEYILRQGKEKGYVFTAVTNGVDLPHFIHLLGPGKIVSLQITLDGPRDVHDRTRIGPRHKNGTFDRILDNIKLALEQSEVTIGVRLHLDRKNAERNGEPLKDLHARGLFEHKRFSIYAYPVHNYHHGMGEPVHPYMAIHDVQRLLDGAPTLIDGAQRLRKPDDGIPKRVNQYLDEKLLGLYKVVEPCAATTGMYIFDPLWRIYSCWDTVGINGQETGTYSADGPVLNSLAAEWRRRSPQFIDECRDCKYSILHFGGCASLSLGVKQTLFSPACYQYEDNFIYIASRYLQSTLAKRAAEAAAAQAAAETVAAQAQ